jgi:hypothetical protein
MSNTVPAPHIAWDPPAYPTPCLIPSPVTSLVVTSARPILEPRPAVGWYINFRPRIASIASRQLARFAIDSIASI